MLLYDRDAIILRDLLKDLLLANLADPGTSCDTGQGLGHADLWVTVKGVEYLVSISRGSPPA